MTHTVNYGLVIFIGILGILLAFYSGHIVVVAGVMKKDASLANSQNPELLEIKEDVKRIINILSNGKKQ